MASAWLEHSGPRQLNAGELEAVFLLSRGMLGASLRHRGEELLGRVEDLESSAARGSTAGIPLLHPWANRLNGLHYAAGGQDVLLDPQSPWLHLDSNGLPMHGIGWPLLPWTEVAAGPTQISAVLDWNRPEWLGVFPFAHRLQLTASLDASSLTVETVLTAGTPAAVPVSFGFHPFLRLPGKSRSDWWLRLPPLSRLSLDPRGIPTGAEELFPRFDQPLGDRVFDDGFVTLSPTPEFVLQGGGRRLMMEFLDGYRFAQVYAPAGKDFIALEPMTAPTNALVSGLGLNWVNPGESYRAAFRISVAQSG
jgi:aldose 1-epimerase